MGGWFSIWKIAVLDPPGPAEPLTAPEPLGKLIGIPLEFRQILDLGGGERPLDGGVLGLQRRQGAGHVYGFARGTGVECDIDGGRSFGADFHIGLRALLEFASLHNNRVLAGR